ncbi:MAG: class II aldolase/adducin family protein [Synergistaceae bacterium]|jgi:L-ribulose-5-phosphate 4-epimerase|nr:class II aldolase/adducin family protein [Synergistaceae bacterium]
MKYREIRETVLSAVLKANAMGLIQGTSGNVSMRDSVDPVAAITPSGIPYDNMKPEEISIVDLDGKWLEGPYKPSSETPMHTALMRSRADAAAVIHTHSLFATLMSMRDKPLDVCTVPGCGYYPIPVAAPFEEPGSDALAKRTVDTFGDKLEVIMLRNHGLIALGKTMDAAMTAAVYAEEAAQVNYYALLAGFTNWIPKECVDAVRERVNKGWAV